MAKGGSPREAPGEASGEGAAPTSFGGRLRRLREAVGLTQEELAGRARLSAKAISMLERGERKDPYPHTVRSLADTLGLTEGERAVLAETVPGRTTGDDPVLASVPTEKPAATTTPPSSALPVPLPPAGA